MTIRISCFALPLILAAAWTTVVQPVPPRGGPDCLVPPGSSAPIREEAVSFQSQGITLRGVAYLPGEPGRYPGMALMHGGGGNIEILRITPRFFGRMLARCGFVVVTWDKHGLGESEGDYASSTFDDFVADAGAAGKWLARHEEVDDRRIGVLGFSQGGRLAPVTAHRHAWFSFAASVSGPIAPVKDTRIFALRNSFLDAGVSPEVVEMVMRYWERHLDAVAIGDREAIDRIAAEARETGDGLGGQLLPPDADHLPPGGIYNSMGRDYTEELLSFKKPWYAIFGDADRVVPVPTSIANIERIRQESSNPSIRIRIVPGVDHGFRNPATSAEFPFEREVLAWLMETAGVPLHAGGSHGG